MQDSSPRSSFAGPQPPTSSALRAQAYPAMSREPVGKICLRERARPSGTSGAGTGRRVRSPHACFIPHPRPNLKPYYRLLPFRHSYPLGSYSGGPDTSMYRFPVPFPVGSQKSAFQDKIRVAGCVSRHKPARQLGLQEFSSGPGSFPALIKLLRDDYPILTGGGFCWLCNALRACTCLK